MNRIKIVLPVVALGAAVIAIAATPPTAGSAKAVSNLPLTMNAKYTPDNHGLINTILNKQITVQVLPGGAGAYNPNTGSIETIW